MRSASRLALVLAALLAQHAWCDESPARIRLVVQSSPLAGYRHYDAKEVAAELRVGDRLQLEREADNPHDGNAIAVFWQGRKLGYVPRRDNAALAWALDRGERLHARISRLTSHPNPKRRIELEIYVQ